MVGFVKLHQSPGPAVNVGSREIIYVYAAKFKAFINMGVMLAIVFKFWILG